MADITQSLLAAIAAKIATEKAPGGQLAALQGYLVKMTTTGYVPNYNPNWPLLLVEPLPMSAEVISMPACTWKKTLPIQFTIVYDQSGHNGKGAFDALTLLDKLENVLFLQIFGLAQWAELVSKDYNAPVPLPYAEPSNGAVNLIMSYLYADSRELP